MRLPGLSIVSSLFLLQACGGDDEPSHGPDLVRENTEDVCQDDADNDDDGFVDCEDQDCGIFVFCLDGGTDSDVDSDADTDSDSDTDSESSTSIDCDAFCAYTDACLEDYYGSEFPGDRSCPYFCECDDSRYRPGVGPELYGCYMEEECFENTDACFESTAAGLEPSALAEDWIAGCSALIAADDGCSQPDVYTARYCDHAVIWTDEYITLLQPCLDETTCTTFRQCYGLTHSADCADRFTGCGDGRLDAGEECDGGAFGDESCEDRGFDAGYLSCWYCTIDESTCTTCGDGVLEGSEQCDGDDLGGLNCPDLGFDDGILACDACIYDTTGCV